MGMIECNNVEGINNLRNAVVICAVQDWNSAMKIMNRKGIDKNSDRYKNAEKQGMKLKSSLSLSVSVFFLRWMALNCFRW